MLVRQDHRRRSSRPLSRVAGLAAIVLGTLASAPARAASWKTNVNYGATTAMDLYVPDGVGASPAVVVSLHYCGGTAANAHGWFQSYADTNKFLIIAPKSAGSCFDAGLGRTGERADIVKMVQYVVTMNNADPKKVFAAGPSSGACMTQALLASYPDVFAGGSSLAGVPAGAWTGGGAYGWSAPASTTAQQWGDKVRNADPGFAGGRPRVQFWQGMGDTNLTYSQTYPSQLAQWTNVFGVTDANATKESIKPPGASNTWARTSYKDCSGLVVVEANSGPSNVVHDLTPEGLWSDVVRFFGLAQGGTAVGGPCGGTGGAGGGAGGAGGGSGGAGGRGGTTGGAGGRGGVQGTAGTGGGNAGSGAGGSSAGTGGSSARGGSSGTGSGGSIGTGAGGVVGTGTGGSSSTGTGGSIGTGSGGAIVTGSAGTAGPAGTGGSGNTAGTGGPAGASGQGTGGSGSGGSGIDVPPDGGDAGCACNLSAGESPSAVAALLFATLATLGLARRRRVRARRGR
jgi:poly(hydroxyalkanoate) depolymerase family esterase